MTGEKLAIATSTPVPNEFQKENEALSSQNDSGFVTSSAAGSNDLPGDS